MFERSARNTVLKRGFAVLIILQFVGSSVLVNGYAAADNLRPSATKKAKVEVEFLKNDLTAASAENKLPLGLAKGESRRVFDIFGSQPGQYVSGFIGTERLTELWKNGEIEVRGIEFLGTEGFVFKRAGASGWVVKREPGVIYGSDHEAINKFLREIELGAWDKKYTQEIIDDSIISGSVSAEGKIYIQAIPGMAKAMRERTGHAILGHYGIRPDAKGNTYIYIDEDAYKGKNGKRYVDHEIGGLKFLRFYAKNQGWSLDQLAEWLNKTGKPEEVAAVLADAHNAAPGLPEGIEEIVTDSNQLMVLASDRPVREAAEGRPVSGAAGVDLSGLVTFVQKRFLVLANYFSLGKGARTGQVNSEVIMDEGAQGSVTNHSEPRGDLERDLANMLGNILRIGVRSRDASEKATAVLIETLQRKDLIGKDLNKLTVGEKQIMAQTLPIIIAFLDSAKDEAAIELYSRKIVNKIENVRLKTLIADAKRIGSSFAQTVVCIGETFAQYNSQRTQEVLKMDLKEILDGLTQDDIRFLHLRFAYEPRWAIGTDKTPTSKEIQTAHRLIKDTVKDILGVELEVDYGGSLKAKNAKEFLSLPDVNGGLIGGDAKTVNNIVQIIRIANQVGKEFNKVLNIGMNWKAEVASTGLDSMEKFAESFKELLLGEDLTFVRIAISTPQVQTAKNKIVGPLLETEDAVKKAGGDLNIPVDTLKQGLIAGAQIDAAKGGQTLDEYIKALLTPVLTGEKIFDSRGRMTERAIIDTGLGIRGIGEAPAGESKGIREAPTVDAAYGVDVVMPKIAQKFKESNLDLRKYSELIRAHQIIKDMFGNDFTQFGGNTFTAVSWALFDLHAKLNNKTLTQSIRDGNPWFERIRKQRQGDMFFITNNLNHGKHTNKKAGVMGKDVLDAQEIMFVALTPNAKSLGEKLKTRLQQSDDAFKGLGKVLDAERKKGNIKNIFIGDEGGFSMGGVVDLRKAIDYIIQSGEAMGLRAGIDFMISFDIAASSFYGTVTEGKYNYMGVDRSPEEMSKYYVDLVDEYITKYGRNIFYTFEDPLAENDWDNWPLLTAALEKRGVLTVGDDLYCTQLDLLRKGIAMHASSKILIKVNQVGSVLEAIEVIKLALENNIGIIISHRSGETLFSKIADLFMAFEADALKAGATQPQDFVFETDDVPGQRNVFGDEKLLVRRKKYDGTVNIAEGKDRVAKPTALVISTDYIKASGLKPISKLANLPDTELIIVGKDADRVMDVLRIYGVDSRNIQDIQSMDVALKFLTEAAKVPKIAIMLTPEEKNSLALPAGVQATVISSKGLVPAEELAMAVYALHKSDSSKQALTNLHEKIAKNVISAETKQDLNEMLSDLDKGSMSFPDDAKFTAEVSNKIASAKQADEQLKDAI
jgi:enolase/triosephosphate isomerase